MSAAPGVSPGSPDPRQVYVYVDVAFGGVDRRNNVRRLDLVRADGRADQYCTYQRATRELPDYLLKHRNRKNKPSVEGFPGPTWTPVLPLDFDDRDDPSVALGWVRRVLLKLEAWGVDLRAVRCFFSGGKGFHLEIPAALFGGFEPSTDLHRWLKRAAELLMEDIPFDGSIYDKLRLWRLENSRHGKTGLYKVRLSAREVLTLDIAAIKALAAQPRAIDGNPELTPIADDDLLPNAVLVELWAEAGRTIEAPKRERQAGAVTDDARDRQTIAAIAADWPHGGPDAAGTSRHTDYLMPIAGFLAGQTSEKHARELLCHGAEAAGDADFLEGRDWEAEIERLVGGSAERRDAGQPFTGLPTLAERFPALAAVLGALWPAPAIDREPDLPSSGAAAGGPGASDIPPQPGASGRQVRPDLPSVPPFPVEVLPPAPRRLVEEGAAATGAPPDMIAVPLLGFAGALIGRGQRLQLKYGWWERPQLYAASVAVPGSLKSPALSLARSGLDALQDEAWALYRERMAAFKADQQSWEKTPPKDRGPAPKRPVPEHFFMTDATTEAIAVMLHGRPEDAVGSPGIAVVVDEAVSWVKSCDAYRGGRGGDRQRWLSMWSGAPLKVDRKAGDPIYVPSPVVCVVGGIQPEMLGALAEEAGRRDGFVERILWSFPDTKPAAWSEREVGEETREAVTALFRRMRRAAAADTGSPLSAARPPVKLDPEAKAAWVRWFDENAGLTAVARGLAAGIHAKMPSQAARLALILHCMTHPDDPWKHALDLEAMEGAVELAEYFRAHAARVLPFFGGTASGHGAGLLERIARILRREDDWVSREHINRKLGGHVPSDDVGAALESLAAAGRAVSKKEADTGGRPRELWRYTHAEKRRNVESPAPEAAEPPESPVDADLSTFLRFSADGESQPTDGPERPNIRDPKTGRRLRDPYTLEDGVEELPF